MRELLSNDDLKRLAQGVSAACAAGLLLGAAMQPNLKDDRGGPQQLVASGGLRAADLRADAGVGAYPGAVPEYVTGTDWTRPQPMLAAAEATPPAPDDDVALAADDDPPPVRVARAEWREPPPLPRTYPSSDGGVPYEGELPPPPPPPGDDEPS